MKTVQTPRRKIAAPARLRRGRYAPRVAPGRRRRYQPTHHNASAWQSIPWPIRWFLWGTALVFLGSAAILILVFLIGVAQVS